jgi:endo-1,4-beta-xylanase
MKTMKLVLLALSMIGFLMGCVSEGESANAPETKATTITANTTGTDGGYFYSFWNNGGGSVTMKLDGANGYRVGWSNCGEFTCGKGWGKGSGHTISYSGYFDASGGGAFGIYGWTTNPLVEYYIIEKSGADVNPATSGTFVGKVTSDGDTYDIYKNKQIDQPSIQGTATFMQYKSFRQTPRTSGTITVQNHFAAWAKLGLELGTRHNYQILLTEGWNGSGSAHSDLPLSRIIGSLRPNQFFIGALGAFANMQARDYSPLFFFSSSALISICTRDLPNAQESLFSPLHSSKP